MDEDTTIEDLLDASEAHGSAIETLRRVVEDQAQRIVALEERLGSGR